MLDLFLSVALDAFQECLQTLLVPLSELVHFAQKCLPEAFLHDLSLIHFLLPDHVFHRVRLVIVLHREEDLLLLAHLNQSFTIALLQEEVLGYLLFI